MSRNKTVIKRIVAMFIAMAVVISSIHISSAQTYAGYVSSIVGGITEKIQDITDDAKEVVDDNISGVEGKKQAGDWTNAIFVDKLPWNYFHMEVQKDIKKRNIDNVRIERYIKRVKRKSGKISSGRVDIVQEREGKEYFWEVKPLSYYDSPLRDKAVTQLGEYVYSVNEYEKGKTAVAGGGTIGNVTNGTIERHIEVPNKEIIGNTKVTTITYVKYIIDYQVYSDGIVLYKFDRDIEGKETETETETEPEHGKEFEPDPPTIGDPLPIPPEREEDPEEEVSADDLVDLQHLQELVLIANSLSLRADELIAIHTEINSNPDLNNSLSTSIIGACTAFKAKLLSLMPKIKKIIKLCMLGEVGAESLIPVAACADELDGAISDFELALETYVDDEETEELQKAVEEGDEEAAKEIIGDMQSNADDYNGASECPPKDPLIIDLGQEGVELTTIENGVNFDLDCNGFSERTVWIDTEDGFLAFDRNNNGKIDNGKELFGDGVELSDGRISENGFEVLAELDSNNDGIVDCNDDEFNKLLIWIDYNHNGISESNELITAQEKGVVSINLSYDTQVDEDNTTILKMSDIADVTINIDGEEQITHLIEYWFEVNPANTLSNNKMTTGNIPNLEKAIIEDDELFNLVMEFYMSKNVQMKRYLVKSILYHLADADDIAPNSRGGNMNARDLKVVEAFMGRPFVGYNNNKNPNSNAAVILKKIYKNLEDDYYILLNTGTIIRDYCNMICEYVDDDGNKVYDMSFLFVAIDLLVCQEYDLKSAIFDIGMYLNYSDKKNNTHLFEEYKEHYSSISKEYEEVLEKIGVECEDDDILIYGDGDDTIEGAKGEDILAGGKGKDVLRGGSGNDTYIFNKGDGQDTILDAETSDTDGQEDTIVFGEGISSEDVDIQRSGSSLKIIYGDGDVITVQDAFYSSTARNYVEKIKFADASEILVDYASLR